MSKEHDIHLFDLVSPTTAQEYREVDWQRVSVRGLIAKLPSPEAMLADLRVGTKPELLWVVSEKNEHSRASGMVALPGGRLNSDDVAWMHKKGEAALEDIFTSKLGAKANLHDLHDVRPLIDTEYNFGLFGLQSGSIKVITAFSPLHDWPGNVADKDHHQHAIHMLTSSQMRELMRDGFIMVDGRRLHAMNYLRHDSDMVENGFTATLLDHIDQMEELFCNAVDRLMERSGQQPREPEGWVVEQLMVAEAQQYLRPFADDAVRAIPVFMHSLWYGGRNLWPYREELLDVLGGARSEVAALVNTIQSIGNRAFESHFVEIGWDEVSAHEAVRQFWSGVTEAMMGQGRMVRSELSPRNEIIGARLDTLASIVRTGRKHGVEVEPRIAYEAARYLGIAWLAGNLRSMYKEKFLQENELFDSFLMVKFSLIDGVQANFGFHNSSVAVREYKTQSGARYALVVDKGDTKSMASFIRKAILVGDRKLNEIADIDRVSIVFLGALDVNGRVVEPHGEVERYQWVVEFYSDLLDQMRHYGLQWGSKLGLEGKEIRNQLGIVRGEKGVDGLREGSIANLFAEAKGYVFARDAHGLMTEITEMAVWALPYGDPMALQGKVAKKLPAYGYLEKRIDDEGYAIRRLIKIFRFFFSNLLYSPEVHEKPFRASS